MSDKKKKDIPAQEPEKETAAPAAENTESTEPAAETVPETFTVTREQMEKMEGLAKLVADVNDKYLRLAAEYDNYRKRTAKEKESVYSDAKADTIKPFLAVYDNLERALKQDTADEAYKKGVELTMNELVKIFTSLGVEIFGEAGEHFDPSLHNAVMHTEDDRVGESTITQVFQKGFKLGEKIVRFAMVQVAN